ncbi:MAG: HNH endonuclease [Terriglobia bacterium]|nr:HNH endonuclease [Terriglobia bacterium]
MKPESILVVDRAGKPDRWIDLDRAAKYYAEEQVAWEAGTTHVLLHGGINAASGRRSVLKINSILSIHSEDRRLEDFDAEPTLTRTMVLRRDRFVCAYCAQVYGERLLTIEHIVPLSRGGESSWKNLVAACKACNNRKGARTPEEAGMTLCYLPYVPNRHEAFILRRRKILADQMEFLLRGVGKESRLKN